MENEKVPSAEVILYVISCLISEISYNVVTFAGDGSKSKFISITPVK